MDTVCRIGGGRRIFGEGWRRHFSNTVSDGILCVVSACKVGGGEEIVGVNRKTTFFFLLSIAAITWAAGSFAGGFTLRVDGAAKSVRFSLPGNVFGLSWTHSVELTQWRESYAIGPGGEIVLTASAFASAGAGLPDRLADGEVFRRKDGTMRIEGRRVPVGDLRVRLSDVSPHVLHVGERAVDLNSLFGEGVVTIRGVVEERQ